MVALPYWVENDGPLGRIVRRQSLNIVLDALGSDSPHVDDKSAAAQVCQVDGFFGVVGHDGTGAYRESHVGGKVLDDLRGRQNMSVSVVHMIDIC